MIFPGIDILTDKNLEAGEIQDGVSKLFNIKKEAVTIINDYEDLLKIDKEEIGIVLCMVNPAQGDFTEHISIDTKDGEVNFDSMNDVIKFLATYWKVNILFHNKGETNPYIFWRMGKDGTLEKVSLSTEVTDMPLYFKIDHVIT